MHALVPDDLMTVPQLADKLKIGLTKAWQLVWDRKIGHHAIGKRVLISNSQYEAFLASTEAQPFDAKQKAREILRKR